MTLAEATQILQAFAVAVSAGTVLAMAIVVLRLAWRIEIALSSIEAWKLTHDDGANGKSRGPVGGVVWPKLKAQWDALWKPEPLSWMDVEGRIVVNGRVEFSRHQEADGTPPHDDGTGDDNRDADGLVAPRSAGDGQRSNAKWIRL